MKLARVVRILLLISMLGASALIYAQDQREEPKPKEDDARPEAVKPRDEANPPRHQEDAKPTKQQQEEAKTPKQQEEAKPSRDERKPTEQENGKATKQNEHEQMSQQHAQGGQHGGRIPDDKFRGNFGRQHTVVINRPTMVEGQPRFQFGGYWFNMVDAWPGDWAYTDECYVDYIDGEYFLFDLLHPGVRIALFVVL